MATILHDEDVDDNDAVNPQDAANLFLERWTDADDKPSGNEKGNKAPKAAPETEDADEAEDDDLEETEDQDDTEDDTADDDDDSEDDDAPVAEDAHKVKVVVDGEERTVSVKDLKRLYGQEASLTRKSQEVAALRKQAADEATKTTTALNTLIERASERWKPYADVDYLVAQTQLSPEDFAALRAEAKAAYDDYAFLTAELDQHQQTIQVQHTAATQEAAKAAVEVLTRDIPNWGQKLYDDIRQFAVKSGLDENAVNSVVDPAIIKLLHAAMLYERGKQNAVIKTKKVAASPKKVLKTDKSASPAAKAANDDSLKRLGRTGKRDDAVSAFLSRWENMDD